MTCGGASSGYCEIGATHIATAPPSTIRIEMTADRIGRSMKKWVNMRCALFLLLSGFARFRARHPGLGGARLRCSAGRGDLDRLPGNDLQHALDHDAVPGVQAAHDDDVLVADVVADDNRPHFFSVGGSWEINKRWLLSARMKWASGLPDDDFIVHDDVLGPGL